MESLNTLPSWSSIQGASAPVGNPISGSTPIRPSIHSNTSVDGTVSGFTPLVSGNGSTPIISTPSGRKRKASLDSLSETTNSTTIGTLHCNMLYTLAF